MIKMSNYNDMQARIEKEKYILILFSSKHCNVCHAVYPRIGALVDKMQFPAVHIDVFEAPDISAQLGIFSIPAVLLFYKGKEHARQARFIDYKSLEFRMEQMLNEIKL